MPGTSAGLKKAWETRRAKYGPSGHAPQTLAKSSSGGRKAKSEDGSQAKSSKPKAPPKSNPKSSRNSNRETRNVRAIHGVTLPYDRQLELLGYEREEKLKAIRAHDRRRSQGVKAPAPYIENMYQRSHDEAVRALRKLDDAIAARQEFLLQQERKKHGRRYN